MALTQEQIDELRKRAQHNLAQYRAKRAGSPAGIMSMETEENTAAKQTANESWKSFQSGLTPGAAKAREEGKGVLGQTVAGIGDGVKTIAGGVKDVAVGTAKSWTSLLLTPVGMIKQGLDKDTDPNAHLRSYDRQQPQIPDSVPVIGGAKYGSPDSLWEGVRRVGEPLLDVVTVGGVKVLSKNAPDFLKAFGRRPVAELVNTLVKDGSKVVDDAATSTLTRNLSEFDVPETQIRLYQGGMSPAEANAVIDTVAKRKIAAEKLEQQLAKEREAYKEMMTRRSEVFGTVTKRTFKEVDDKILPRILKTNAKEAAKIEAGYTKLAQSLLRNTAKITQKLAGQVAPGLQKLLRDAATGKSDPYVTRQVLQDTSAIITDYISKPSRITKADAEALFRVKKRIDELAKKTARQDELAAVAANPKALREKYFAPARAKASAAHAAMFDSKQAAQSARITQLQEAVAATKKEVEALETSKEYQLINDTLNAAFREDGGKIVSAQNVIVDPAVVRELETARDISAITIKDPFRVADEMLGNGNNAIKKITTQPALEALGFVKTGMRKVEHTLFGNPKTKTPGLLAEAGLDYKSLSRGAFVKQVAGKFGLDYSADWTKKQARMSERLRDIYRTIEGRLDDAGKARFDPRDQKIVDYLKTQFKHEIDQNNAIRKMLNIPEIPVRKDYVTHLKGYSFLRSMGRKMEDIGEDEIDGIASRYAKDLPNKKRTNRFEKERTDGLDFEEDPIDALLSYTSVSLRDRAFNLLGANVKAYLKFMPPNAKKYWTNWLNEAVYGGVTDMDDFFNRKLGQGVSHAASRFAAITGRGAISANISNTLLQPSSMAITMAKGGLRDGLRGLAASLTQEGRDFALKHSNVLKSRDPDLALAGVKEWGPEKFANHFMRMFDEQTVRHAFLTFYHKGLKANKGDHKLAVHFADEMAAKTQAMYDTLLTPAIMRPKVGRPLTQFQTYGLNLFQNFTSDIKRRYESDGAPAAMAEVMKLWVWMQLANKAYDTAGIVEPFGIADNPSDGIPFISGWMKYGPPIVVKSVWAMMKVTSGDPYTTAQGIEELKEVLPLAVPGGNQIQKSVRGLNAIIEGGVTVNRKEYPVESAGDALRVLGLGPYGLPAVQEVFEEREKKKQIGALKELTGQEE